MINHGPNQIKSPVHGSSSAASGDGVLLGMSGVSIVASTVPLPAQQVINNSRDAGEPSGPLQKPTPHEERLWQQITKRYH